MEGDRRDRHPPVRLRFVQDLRLVSPYLRVRRCFHRGSGLKSTAAIRDTEQAIHSLKRALYFRLKLDDAALDRAQ